MNWQDHIVTDKDVLLGKPTIKGTRISIDHLVGLLAQGWSEKQILDNYPRITGDSLKAIFVYLHDCMQAGLFEGPFKKTA